MMRGTITMSKLSKRENEGGGQINDGGALAVLYSTCSLRALGLLYIVLMYEAGLNYLHAYYISVHCLLGLH